VSFKRAKLRGNRDFEQNLTIGIITDTDFLRDMRGEVEDIDGMGARLASGSISSKLSPASNSTTTTSAAVLAPREIAKRPRIGQDSTRTTSSVIRSFDRRFVQRHHVRGPPSPAQVFPRSASDRHRPLVHQALTC